MLKFDSRPRKQNAPRPAEKAAPGFLQWLRGRSCVFAADGKCEGKIEAMHLDFAGGKGMGTKVADRYAIPGCAGHHSTQHRIGWATFMHRVGTSPNELMIGAAKLWNAWPGRAKWELKQNG